MRKENWYDFIRWPKQEKERFPFRIVNKQNQVSLYEQGEEKKYKTALKKHLDKINKDNE